MFMAYWYDLFEHHLRLWMGIWLHTHTVTTTSDSPDSGELAEIQPDASVQTCHYPLVGAVEPLKLHPIFMSYIHEVFEHLLRLWMGKLLKIHIITNTYTSPDLGRWAELLTDASVQTMLLPFGRSCRTFQTASHIHVIHS